MPIRPELRHLYRGPAWRAIRERILARAEHRCEHCGAPNLALLTRAGQWWRDSEARLWREARIGCGLPDWMASNPRVQLVHMVRMVEIVLTIAHLDHDPTNNDDANLAALCQWCHFAHDQSHHVANSRRTRQARKDAGRPLLVAAAAEEASW